MIIQRDVFSDAWCDFIFESRNKSYGAYALRKRYPDNVGIAFFITVAVFGLGLSAPTIYGHFFSKVETEIKVPDGGIDLYDLPPMIPPDVPKDVTEKQPPSANTIKDTPPVIVSSPVTNDPIATDDMLAEANPGTTTQTGVTETGTGTGTTVVETFVVANPAPIEPEFYKIVEEMPQFMGGEAEMLSFIMSRIKYPQVPKELGISGVAYISFIVNKEGKVQDAKVVKGFDRQCEQEALRVINSMPLWKPGKQNGKAVNVQFTLPIRFILQ